MAGRLGISVSAAFAWRCPTSRTLRPVSTSPLIERSIRISRTPLSDKSSYLRPRQTLRSHRQADETQCPVQVIVGVA